mmetsp:Transcript_21483/g.28791  ORF Transcript_21483/g.28791 Transcript_21483/m.28791 type:complete len:156 (-) Transcript_21483:1109-1576(-)
MMLGMSPRLASLNSGHEADDPGTGTGENMMNSSCKDTVKMTDRREFSFFESVNKEFGNANAALYHGSLGQSRQGNNFESINVGQINDTVSRLPGLNTSEMNREAGMMYGPDGAPCNPFISDSYLFLNSVTNETYNFGLNSQETPHGGNVSNHLSG